MQFPRPMRKHRFNNEYDVLLFTLSALLHRFENEDRLFAAQCIWWLANIIQLTEILTYNPHYKVFMSDYVKNLVVTPLLGSATSPLGSEISALDIEESNHHSDLNPRGALPNQRTNTRLRSHLTHSGRILKKPKKINYSNSDLQRKFRNQNKQKRKHTRLFLKTVGLEYWGRLCLRRNTADSIWMSDLWRNLEERICEDMCQFRLHYQQAKYYRCDIN